jgi:hypothetical protein
MCDTADPKDALVSFVGNVLISFAMLQKHHDYVVTHFVQWGRGKAHGGKPLGLPSDTEDVYSNPG